METYILNNGVKIPSLGLGTWLSKDTDAYNAVLHAIKSGYRHIDTAMIYGNEEQVGRAIKDSGVDREELFITTKLWNTDQGYESAKRALDLSLEKLGLEYVDLYLIHWFKGYEKALDSWKAMEEAYLDGRAKAIGVSNFNIHHIQYLLEHGTVTPMVNQVETHIELPNIRLQQFCMDNDIYLEAYAPLMSRDIKTLLENDLMNDLADKYQKTVAQVAIKWLLQRDIIVIPKSTNPGRIEQNFDVFDFEISSEDMERIKTLATGKKRFPEMDNVPF